MKKKLCALLLGLLLLWGCAPRPERTTVTVAMPYSGQIQNTETNYYKRWLEEHTGLRLEISFIPEAYTEEYLRLFFSNGDSAVDAVFFPLEQHGELAAQIEALGREGHLLPLDLAIRQWGEHSAALFADFSEYDLERAITAGDGHIYYLPSLTPSLAGRNAQTFWINTAWLGKLGLRMPQTVEELRQVLTAFRDGDPNGNGQGDELPLLGGGTALSRQAAHFLINSFVYDDPRNSYLAVEDGRVSFSPATEGWREAMVYLNSLYRDGLIDPVCFDLDDEQLSQLVLDGRELVGAFAGRGIDDVLGGNASETMSRYSHVPPLAGPDGTRRATADATRPLVGGVISAHSPHAREVFGLMDLMLSQEASLIACYGEEGVDWSRGAAGDLDVFGRPAAIHVQNRVQNKTLAGAGPMSLSITYRDSVTWSGLFADLEYVNARAALDYQPYLPQEHIKVLRFTGGAEEDLRLLRRELTAFVEESLRAFLTGAADPNDNADWNLYLARLDLLGAPKLVAAAQTAYEEMEKKP